MQINPAEITISQPKTGCSAEAEIILRALPMWFGNEKATLKYIESAGRMPTILAMHNDDAVGFLIIDRHFPESAEIHCIGVLPDFHGQGIGRKMIEMAEATLAADGARFFQVKTVAPYEGGTTEYERTRAFYQAVGFMRLEVFPELWDPDDPCLLMIKTLDATI